MNRAEGGSAPFSCRSTQPPSPSSSSLSWADQPTVVERRLPFPSFSLPPMLRTVRGPLPFVAPSAPMEKLETLQPSCYCFHCFCCFLYLEILLAEHSVYELIFLLSLVRRHRGGNNSETIGSWAVESTRTLQSKQAIIGRRHEFVVN